MQTEVLPAAKKENTAERKRTAVTVFRHIKESEMKLLIFYKSFIFRNRV